MRSQVVISKEGEKFIRLGQLWMYRNNLVEVIGSAKCGDLVDLVNEEKEYLGTGFYSDISHVVVRLLTMDQTEEINESFFEEKIAAAYEYRKTIEREDFSHCRLIFGEADLLPGVTVDRYNNILVSQITSYGMEMRKGMLYEILLRQFEKDGIEIDGIYERNDVKVRSKEGLPLEKGWYLRKGDLSTKTTIQENGIYLNVDIENGQKTGYFLDQKRNRMLVQRMAHGKRVLDCFTHTGGFALNAAYGNASKVTAVDVSATALEQALENAKMNHLENRMEFVQDDVFHYLETCPKHQFDLIILDPPAFTKSRKTVDHAYNGYKEINEKAMRLLGRGGYLVTCSCSRFMENETFEEMLRDAAKEAKVMLKQISVSQQNMDHPILWNMAETSYLKFYIFQLI